MKIVNVAVDWNNEDSIEAAETLKAELENKGYSQVNHFGGFNQSVIVYGLKH